MVRNEPFGERRYPSLAWWIGPTSNSIMLGLGVFAFLPLVGGAATWGHHPAASAALIGYGLVVAVTVACYLRVAITDSRAGSTRLSRKGLAWFGAGVAEFVVPLIVGIVWFTVTRHT